MGIVPMLWMVAAVGVGYGWTPDGGGGVEYVIQISPDKFDQAKASGEITSTIDPEVRGHVSRVIVRVGDGPLERVTPPEIERSRPPGDGPPGDGPRARVDPQSSPENAAFRDDLAAVPIPEIDHSGRAVPIVAGLSAVAVRQPAATSVMKPAPQSPGGGFSFPAAESQAPAADRNNAGAPDGNAAANVALQQSAQPRSSQPTRASGAGAIDELRQRAAGWTNQMAGQAANGGRNAIDAAAPGDPASIRGNRSVTTTPDPRNDSRNRPDASSAGRDPRSADWRNGAAVGPPVGTRDGVPSTAPAPPNDHRDEWYTENSRPNDRTVASDRQTGRREDARDSFAPNPQARARQDANSRNANAPRQGDPASNGDRQTPPYNWAGPTRSADEPRDSGLNPDAASRESDPRYASDPRGTADPRYADPRYADPRYADPRYGDTRYADPRFADPRYGVTDRFGRMPPSLAGGNRDDTSARPAGRDRPASYAGAANDPRWDLPSDPRAYATDRSLAEQRELAEARTLAQERTLAEQRSRAELRRAQELSTADSDGRTSLAEKTAALDRTPRTLESGRTTESARHATGNGGDLSSRLGDRDLTSAPTGRSRSAKSVAAQPVFNGLLLFSFVANIYLAVWLKNLRYQFRDMVTAQRTARAGGAD